MKKIGLICAAVLVCGSLTACGNEHSYNLKKLRAEHSKLLKQSKKQSDHKKHSTKEEHSSKQNASKQNSSSNNKTASSKKNEKENSNNNNSQQSNNTHQKVANSNSSSIPSSYQENINKGLEWDGTRRRDSFSSDADYQRYNAWHQGFNYDPSTGNLTPMNQQQLNDMRQQMSNNGGQDFK